MSYKPRKRAHVRVKILRLHTDKNFPRESYSDDMSETGKLGQIRPKWAALKNKTLFRFEKTSSIFIKKVSIRAYVFACPFCFGIYSG